MNGEQKGGVKNHFRTLFRIIKKKQLKTKKIEEEQKKLKEKEIKIQKNKVIDFGFNNDKKIINPQKSIKLNVNIPKKKILPNPNSKIINNVEVKKQKIKDIDRVINKEETKLLKKFSKLEKEKNNIENKKYKVVPKNNIIKPTKIKKAAKKNPKEIEKRIENKNNKELEKSILKRINKIIENDKYDIENLKIELNQIDKDVKEANDKEKINKIKLQFEMINKRIAKIKRDFEIIKDNIDFEEYEELNNYFLIDEIDDFKYQNDCASIELLCLKCKQQIEVLEDIVNMYEEATTISKKVNNKEKEVKYFDESTPEIKSKTNEIDLIAKKINNNLNLQTKFIDEMNKKIGEAQFKTKIYYKFQGMNELLNNTLTMGLGMYSFSSMRRPRFRTLKFLIGSILVYNSVKGMLKFLNPEITKETYVYYNDYTSELEKGMSNIVLTHNFINSTIKDMDILKRDFKNKFMEYQYDLPEYDIMLDKIEMIQKQLLLQKKEINKIEKELEEQKSKNKMYAKKIESYTEIYK